MDCPRIFRRAALVLLGSIQILLIPACGDQENLPSCLTEFVSGDESGFPSHQYNAVPEPEGAGARLRSPDLVRLTFYGAARMVGGACTLVEFRGKRILIDAGIFYLKSLLPLDRRFEFDPAGIDAVILTHAHGDHNGRIPLLYRLGYRGKVYCTPATRDVSEIMLELGAGLSVSRWRVDFRNRSVHGQNCRLSRELRPEEHLDLRDARVWTDILGFHSCTQCRSVLGGVQSSLGKMIRDNFLAVRFGETTELFPGTRFRLHNSGHILGSSQLELVLGDGESATTIVFTGDLGNQISPMDRLPDVLERADYLVTESTYGAVRKRFRSPYYEDFIRELEDAVEKGRRVIIPAFVLSKSQKIIALLSDLAYQGKIPRRCPIIVSSPTVAKLNEVHQRYLQQDADAYYCPEFARRKNWRNPFDCPQFFYGSFSSYEKKFGPIPSPAIFLVSSGMMDFAASLEMAQDYLGDPASEFFVVGWQSPDSTGEAAMNLDEVVIKGNAIPVKATIRKFGQFSSHADLDMLLLNVSHYRGLKGVIVHHGEAASAMNLAREIQNDFGYPVFVPAFLDSLLLDRRSFLKVEHDLSSAADCARQLDPILALPSDSQPPSQRAAAANLAQAVRAAAGGNRALALKYARDAVARDPSLADAFYFIGESYRALGEDGPAEESFRSMIRINPADYRPYLSLARICLKQKRLADAAVELRSCLYRQPEEIEALALLGDVYLALGFPEFGLELLKAANAIDPYDEAIGARLEKQAAAQEKRAVSYVASRQGKVFHYPWCAHARKISEANLVRAATRSEFLKKKYLPCSLCSP